MKGSIRRRGDTWTAYWFTIDRATGKQVQHSKGGFIRKEPSRPPKGDSAREFLNGIIGKVQSGDWKPDKTLSIEELLNEHWLPAQRSRNLRPSTVAQYETVIRSWIVPHIGPMRAASLTPADLQELSEKLRTSETTHGYDGLSPRSLQLVIGTLKSAYTFAVATELLNRSPIMAVRRPTVQQRTPTSWSNENAREFLTKTRDDHLSALWAIALTRGLRRGELAGLRWDAIDLEAGTLRVVHTLIMLAGKTATSSPKTKAGRRTIPLDASLISLLTYQRKVQAAERLRAGTAWTDLGYIFTNPLGVPYSPGYISSQFDELVKTTGLPRIRLHDCRHTAASLLLASGVQPKVVQEMLGHSNVKITLDIYGHVTPSMGRDAGEALSSALLG